MKGKGIRLLFAPEDDGRGGGPSLSGFDDSEAPETEIITLGPGESAPSGEEDEGDSDKVTLSKEEFEELKSGSNSANVLANSIGELKEALGGGQREPANIQQQPGESDEDFEKRLESDLFAEGKSAKAIKEAIQRYSGSQTGQLMGMISAQNKRLLALDEETGPVFKRYKGEIEDFVKKLPVEQQNHPQVWEYAFNQVKEQHKGELESEKVSSLVEKEVEKRLKEMGIDPNAAPGSGTNAQGKRVQAPYMESGRGSANVSTSGGRKTKKVYATKEDERIAAVKGVPLKQYLKNKGKM